MPATHHLFASVAFSTCVTIGLLSTSGCGGTSDSNPSGNPGADAAVSDPSPSEPADARVPLAPRCTTPRPPAPLADLPAGPPASDGGLGFFAKHPLPQVPFNGGPILPNPRVVPIFFAGDPMAQDLEDFVGSVGCTDYWRDAVGEYGVGDALAGRAVHLAEEAPPKMTDEEIQSWLADKIADPQAGLEAPTADTIYVIFFPERTTITDSSGSSCKDFGGYHSNITTKTGTSVAYAAIPRCGQFQGLSALDEVTSGASHEISEAATDPFDTSPAYAYVDAEHLPWFFVLGGELGDLCAQEPDAFFHPAGYPFAVQRNWSNRAARAGGSPCRPKGTAPLFSAAPTLPDDVTLMGRATRGVRVPVGGSKTIDLDLYTEEPGATLQVQVFDASQGLGYGGGSKYALDASSGKGGDTLHLTISTPAGAATHPELFAILVRSGGAERIAWAGAVAH